MKISEFIKFMLANNDRLIQRNTKRKKPHRTRTRVSGSRAQVRKERMQMARESRRRNR